MEAGIGVFGQEITNKQQNVSFKPTKIVKLLKTCLTLAVANFIVLQGHVHRYNISKNLILNSRYFMKIPLGYSLYIVSYRHIVLFFYDCHINTVVVSHTKLKYDKYNTARYVFWVCYFNSSICLLFLLLTFKCLKLINFLNFYNNMKGSHHIQVN